MSEVEGYHKPVLLKEVLDALSIRDAWYLDCTLGDGGHSIEIMARGGSVVGVDVDPQALKRVYKRFKDLGIDEGKYRLIQGNFRDLKNLLQSAFAKASADKQMDPATPLRAGLADKIFAGAIFDLGVSSLQLGSPDRGFSFSKDGLLDMRMDPSLQVRALDLINVLSRKELSELFFKLGEEKYSRQLAATLVSAHQVVKTTRDLANLVEGVYRKAGERRWRVHPATKVFQALRIAVNDELDALREGLEQIKEKIAKNGVILVTSFHSLEDRIVKDTFRKWQLEGLGQVVTKKPVIPTDEEIRANPRARSAKMRVFVRRTV